tara:strand:- start:491 stop:634 length:144 start_codon:yes stop_codon:yes gene_type:complete
MEINNSSKQYDYSENDIVEILMKDGIYAYNYIYPDISLFRKRALIPL